MANINQPRKRNELAEALPGIGAVAGGIIGGVYGESPQAVAGGASAGAGIGQAAGGLLTASEGSGQTEVSGAAQRRMQPTQTMPMQQVEDPIATVEKARVAVANLPPEQQQLFAPALNTGYAALRRQQNPQGVA